MSITRDQVVARIRALEHPEQDHRFFLQTYGVSGEGLRQLRPLFDRWASRAAKPQTQGSTLSRILFEEYLASNQLVSPRQAAFRIGMSPESLAGLIERAPTLLGLARESIALGDFAIQRSFLDTLHTRFPKLRHKIFATHSAKWRAVHEALEGEGFHVTPEPDPDSDEHLSADIDIITSGPLGLRHTVWLNFGKPFFLEPDKTSASIFHKFAALLSKHADDHEPVEPLKNSRRIIGGSSKRKPPQG